MLHVPTITKNLLSVAQFTSDNNVYFEFHPRVFLVKDRETGKLLLRETLEHGLYKLQVPPTSYLRSANVQSQILLSSKSSVELRHNRLGHASIKNIICVLRKLNLPLSSSSSM